MKIVKKAVMAAIGAAVAALCCTAPAGADPANDPCELAVTFLCKFMPVAPNLDHDIDLTQGPATINGVSVPQLPASNPSGAPAASPFGP
ncbi:fibronectin-binding protein [Mycobacterium sp.]|uniref:fibronectin-binding protein n=1 Tax=Mycobacterium sp. TaxID=1785 RepID=UPI001218AC1C|nr:fibronectin-binding protein [Mycobacterium sp.]TAM65219.1 MAG: fibronectin-binding protein [Mycobacterium sp.]